MLAHPAHRIRVAQETIVEILIIPPNLVFAVCDGVGNKLSVISRVID
jgi:hypothetical protein